MQCLHIESWPHVRLRPAVALSLEHMTHYCCHVSNDKATVQAPPIIPSSWSMGRCSRIQPNPSSSMQTAAAAWHALIGGSHMICLLKHNATFSDQIQMLLLLLSYIQELKVIWHPQLRWEVRSCMLICHVCSIISNNYTCLLCRLYSQSLAQI